MTKPIRLKPLEEQVVVVTGASSGIGLATALIAASRGARVVLVARSAATLDDVVEAIGERGGRAHAIALDVADREGVERAADEVVARFGGIDTWINAAGVTVSGRVREVDPADHRRLFDTNFWGIVHGSLAAVRHMARRGGALINVGSELSEHAMPLQAMYSASKHAVKGFTDALRIELRDEGVPVSVTLVQPTSVDTPYPEHARNYLSVEPMAPQPAVAPRDVADAILEAAERPRRDVRVGALAVLGVLGARIAPRVVDRIAGAMMTRQHRDEPPRDPMGALSRPSEASVAGAGRIRGRGDEAAAGPRARRAAAAAGRARARATERPGPADERAGASGHATASGDGGERDWLAWAARENGSAVPRERGPGGEGERGASAREGGTTRSER